MTARRDARTADTARLADHARAAGGDDSAARSAGSARRPGARSARVLLAAAVAVGALGVGAAGVARGQAARPAAARPAGPGGAAAAGPAGLDGLSDDRVMDELAGRGVNSLLNRLFDDRKVPPAERDAFRSLQALRELKAAANLSDARRIELMAKSVEGLGALLPKLTNPDQLGEYGFTLIDRGIGPDANILEYWGDNPVRQARIKPAADLVVQMLNKASDEATRKMDALQSQIRNASDPKMAECERLYEQSNGAKYAAYFATYYRAMAVDAAGPAAKTGMDERRKLLDPAIKYLVDFATPESQAGPKVLVQLGKMALVKGDYPAAKKFFQAVIDKKVTPPGKKEPVDLNTPPPTVWQENEARYFSVVADVLAKKPAEADKAYADLEAWQKGVADAEFKKAAKATEAQLLMLQYRVASGKADAVAAGPERDKLERQAEVALEKLSALDKAFGELVAEQLVSRVRDDTDLTKLQTTVLAALAERGEVEWARPQGQPYDQKVMERGLAAARVLADRKVGENGVTAATVENAKLRIAMFLEKQNKLAEAADQYLAYAADPAYRGKPNAPKAADRAQFLAIQLFLAPSKSAAVDDLYDRMLKVVCNPPYEHAGMYYFYADRMRRKAENVPEAMKFFAKVPRGDKREFDARYWLMVLGEEQLDTVKDAANRNAKVREVAGWAGQVRALGQAAMAAAADAKAKQSAKFRLAHATLIDAKLALRVQPPDAKRAVAVLNGFEASAAGLPQAEALGSQAVFVRATALLAEKKAKEAIVQIKALADNPKTAGFAAQLVQDLLKRLEADIKAAQAAANQAALVEAANLRAEVTGLLMPFADKQADPKVKAEMQRSITYYDANAKFMAGQLLPPGPEKTQRLNEAKAVFTKLLTENKDDVRSDINIAKADYELGAYDAAIGRFVALVQQQKLGPPTIQVAGVGGNTTEKDNDDFWEVNLLLNTARLKRAEQTPGDPAGEGLKKAARESVNQLFIIHGDRTGGEAFRRQYVELRSQLDPQGGATSQPAAAAAAPAPAPAPAAAAK